MENTSVQSVDREVQEQLNHAFQCLPTKSIERSIGRVHMDSLLAQADYQLVAYDNMLKGIQAWLRVIPLALSDVLFNLSQEGEHAKLLIQAERRLPTSLLHILMAMQLRFSQCQSSAQWRWQIADRQSWIDAKHIGLTNCIRGEQHQLIIKSPLLTSHYPLALPRIPDLLDVYIQPLQRIKNPTQNIIGQCKELLQGSLPEPYKVPQLASALKMSVRSLQRHLKGSLTSYSDLLSEVRRSKARSLLCDSAIPISQVALRLGFSESASFIRAFKITEGHTPAEYRKRIREQRSEAERSFIRFLYAENNLCMAHKYQRHGAKIWMEVSNVSYIKDVSAQCEDLDGSWRHFTCAFERWLGPGRELWSSVNIPVRDPLRFRLTYRVGNTFYSDDNQGRDYTLSFTQRYLLGNHPAALLSFQQLHVNGQTFITAKILSKRFGDDHVVAHLTAQNAAFSMDIAAQPEASHDHDVILWQIATMLDGYHLTRLSFSHQSHAGVIHDNNSEEGYLPD